MEIIIYILIGIIIGVIIGLLFSKTKSAAFEANNNMLNESLNQVKNELEKERSNTLQLNRDLSSARTAYVNLEEKLNEHKKEIEKLQDIFTKEFENVANRILKDTSDTFTRQNKTNIDDILRPLGEKIQDFEKKVRDAQIEDTKHRQSFIQHIKDLHEEYQKLSNDATNLTKALKGDTKTQGSWGEFILESILEKSGLVKGREYSVQESLRNKEGDLLRPDVIVKLPEDKNIVIDSKVSLTAYEAYCSSENEDSEKYLSEHIGSIRRQIKELSPKEYQNLYGIQSLDFVLMFIPIEPAFALAVQNDQSLFYDAFEKNIVIVSPTTLLATLRTISSIWKQEKQNRNALDIARQSADLYDKFVGFLEDLKNIGDSLKNSKDSYDKAMNKLVEGRGNLIKRVENLRNLGITPAKSIDQKWLDKAEENN